MSRTFPNKPLDNVPNNIMYILYNTYSILYAKANYFREGFEPIDHPVDEPISDFLEFIERFWNNYNEIITNETTILIVHYCNGLLQSSLERYNAAFNSFYKSYRPSSGSLPKYRAANTLLLTEKGELPYALGGCLILDSLEMYPFNPCVINRIQGLFHQYQLIDTNEVTQSTILNAFYQGIQLTPLLQQSGKFRVNGLNSEHVRDLEKEIISIAEANDQWYLNDEIESDLHHVINRKSEHLGIRDSVFSPISKNPRKEITIDLTSSGLQESYDWICYIDEEEEEMRFNLDFWALLNKPYAPPI